MKLACTDVTSYTYYHIYIIKKEYKINIKRNHLDLLRK